MPRKLKPPSYLRHTGGVDGADRARTVIRWPDGTTESRQLGSYGSPESYAAHARAVEEWRTAHNAPADGSPVTVVRTVADLVAAFWRHAQQHYRGPDGTPTSELHNYCNTFKPLCKLYGTSPLADFGPKALKAVRQAIVDGSWLSEAQRAGRRKKGCKFTVCRKQANQRVSRIKHVFKWAVENELVGVDVYERLRTVAGLQAGRSEAVDHPEVTPVADEVVDATLPHLGQVVSAMVQLQRLTGMRPGEVRNLKPEQVDRETLRVGETTIWVYRPPQHKTRWRGHSKAVAIGPKAQAMLLPFLERCQPGAFLFSPKLARELWRVEARARRKTKVQPSQLDRKKADPQRKHGDSYTDSAYAGCVRRACLKHGIPPWHPHQLRHSAAAQMTLEFGLDGARAALGHRDAKVTQMYAGRDLSQAAEIAAKIG